MKFTLQRYINKIKVKWQKRKQGRTYEKNVVLAKYATLLILFRV